MELTQLYFTLFPSVSLVHLWVLVCLMEAVSLVQEKSAVSRFLSTSGWQPSQNIPGRGRREGRKRWEDKQRKFLISSTKDCTCKCLQGLMEGRESLIAWRGPELINMKITCRNTYNLFSWDDSWPKILFCLPSTPSSALFSHQPHTLVIEDFKKAKEKGRAHAKEVTDSLKILRRIL